MNQTDLIFGDLGEEIAGSVIISVECVEVCRLYPRQNETPMEFARRVYDAQTVADKTAKRMQMIIDHRQSLIPAEVWEQDQQRLMQGSAS